MNLKNNRYKALQSIILLTAIVLLAVFSACLTSAWEFDNIKEIKTDKPSLGYPEITIRNSFLWAIPLDQILDVKLTAHTSKCANGKCSSEQTFKLYYNSSPVENVKFIDGKGKEIKNIPYSLYTYVEEEYIEKEIDWTNTKITCINGEDKHNGVFGKSCSVEYAYKDIKKKRMIKTPYVLGTKFLGEKIIGIDADIGENRFIDYVFKSNGIWMDELAGWTTANCYVGGNDLYIDGDYCVHIFTTNGTFNNTANVNVSSLIIAGGGGGGTRSATGGSASGGGAGGFNYTHVLLVTAGNNDVVVGKGGAGGRDGFDESGLTGANSSFNGIVVGGGGLGSYDGAGGNGGSGGGAYGYPNGVHGGGTANTGQGNNGNKGNSDDATYTNCGGGGGAGSTAVIADAGHGGNGGTGLNFTINGTNVYYAGGGGGAAQQGVGGTGVHGGGKGADANTGAGENGADGTNGTGGGGGGAFAANHQGGRGGDGIVIIRYLAIDITSLTTIQSYPLNNLNSSSSILNVGCNFSSTLQNISSIKLNIYDSSNNLDYSNTEYLGSGITSYNKSWTTTPLTDDIYSWACYGFGNGGINSSTLNRTFTIDSTTPAITIHTPTGNQGFKTNPYTFLLNYTASDSYLQSCWYNSTFNPTINYVTCNDTQEISTSTFGTKIIYVYANDTLNNINVSSSSFFEYGLENSQTYNASTLETATEKFTINLTYDSLYYSAITANLIYNGSTKVGTKVGSGDNVLFNAVNSIPIITTENVNMSFYWSIGLVNLSGTSYLNSSFNNQTVNKIHLELCNDTYTVVVLNFTSYNEQNLTRIRPFNFYGTFNIGSIETKTTSVSLNRPFTNETLLCLLPADKSFYLDGTIQYDYENENITYTSRNYYFANALISNATQHIPLYLLNAEDSTSFILKVQNQQLTPVSNALIYIQKYYPSDGTYKTVQIAKTDDNGESIGFYEVETVDYKHLIYKDGVLLLETSVQKVVGKEVPYTLTFTVGEPTTPWTPLIPNASIETSLEVNLTSKIVTFTYIDASGATNYGRLLVTKSSMNNATIATICDDSSTNPSAILNCNVTGYDGYMIAKGYIDSDDNIVEIINFVISTAKEIFDQVGLIIGFFIILTAGMAFIWNPIAGILAINASMWFVSMIGFISFSPLFLFSIAGVSLLAIWLLKT